MTLSIPELSLVLLVGCSGSGKSTFAKQHFLPTETVSSDACRAMVSNDENSLSATDDAFDLLKYIVGKRLKNGLLTVVDATSVRFEDRKVLIQLARQYHALPTAIVLNLPQAVCEARNEARADRNMGKHVIRKQRQSLKRSLKRIKKEGFAKVHILKSEEEVAAVTGISREKLYSNKKDIHGPFDIIGDIHGCYDELQDLLEKLGYTVEQKTTEDAPYGFLVNPPEERTAIFLGDLVDRGPDSPKVLRLVMSMVQLGTAYCVPGNHDIKLRKYLEGKKVSLNHGLDLTVEQLEEESEAFKKELREFLYKLTSHYVFDKGKLVVAHAGVKEEMQGRGSGTVRSFCLYGETTGEIDEFGLPVRYNWASEYRGRAKVVYGHTPVPDAEWLNKTIDIDTGCVFGGKLTALRYPEEELVEVAAKKVYCEPAKPLEISGNTPLSHQQEYDDLLDIKDVTGKRIVQTRLRSNLTIKEENSIAALEVMSRFALNPKWLIYLPPTMSPCGTSLLEDYLEYPAQAINYYKKRGVKKLVCEEKHMGSRAVLVLGKNEQAIVDRFGIQNDGIGKCYTRTGRNFFTNKELEKVFLQKVVDELTQANFWEKFETDWVCLDCELMPWSAKAQSLLRGQYAAVGAAASHALPEVVQVLEQTQSRGIEGLDNLLKRNQSRQQSIQQYIKAYQQYCWTVNAVEDYHLAPFHILATEGKVYTDQSHEWHMQQIKEIVDASTSIFYPTAYKIIDTQDPESVQMGIDWWLALTGSGGEGMVVKPYDFIATFGREGLIQPAVKCRGKEYLRIIYSPEYDHPSHLERLKNRGLSRKRSLALREFALGIESLERFVRKEPLRKVHESVFGVLALESESVDPRL